MMTTSRSVLLALAALLFVATSFNCVDARTFSDRRLRPRTTDDLESLEQEPKLHASNVVSYHDASSSIHNKHMQEYAAAHADGSKSSGKGTRKSSKGKGHSGASSSRAPASSGKGKGKGKGLGKGHGKGHGKGGGSATHEPVSSGDGHGKGHGKGSRSHGKGKGYYSGDSHASGHSGDHYSDDSGSHDSTDCITRRRLRGEGRAHHHEAAEDLDECEEDDTMAPTASPTTATGQGTDEDDDADDEDEDETDGSATTETPTAEPTQEPVPVPDVNPVDPDDTIRTTSVSVDVDDFRLEYNVNGERLPMREELDALTLLTAQYVKDFIGDIFHQPPVTIIDDVVTEYKAGSFNMVDDLVHIQYDPTASVNSGSEVMTTSAQFNEAITRAFSDINMISYISLLRSLPDGNLFQSVDNIRLLGDDAAPLTPVPEEKPANRSRGSNGGAIAAGAVAVTLLAAGIVIYRRRDEEDEVETNAKKLDKLEGDGTVAGETYAETYAETYDGNGSVGGSSLEYLSNMHHRDGDASHSAPALKILDPIAEGTDDSSIIPTWEGASALSAGHKYHEIKNMSETIMEEGFTPSLDKAEDRQAQAFMQNGHNDNTYHNSDSHDEDHDEHGEDDASLSSEIQSVMIDDFEDEFDGTTSESYIDSIKDVTPSADAAQSIPSLESKKSEDIEAFLSYCLDGSTDSMDVEDETNYDNNYGEQKLSTSDTHDDNNNEHQLESTSTHSSTRPRTVAEIEAMLTCDDSVVGVDLLDEESSVSTRPRTVAEIESMLSIDLDD